MDNQTTEAPTLQTLRQRFTYSQSSYAPVFFVGLAVDVRRVGDLDFTPSTE